jgi:hypothetical protein
MGFKFGIIMPGQEGMSFNTCVFETEKEAKMAGDELLSRWFGPSGYEVVEVEEEANYMIAEGSRPERIENIA